jgi:hypothetical protein
MPLNSRGLESTVQTIRPGQLAEKTEERDLAKEPFARAERNAFDDVIARFRMTTAHTRKPISWSVPTAPIPR